MRSSKLAGKIKWRQRARARLISVLIYLIPINAAAAAATW